MLVLFFSGSHHSYVVFPITEPLSVSTVLSIFWTECFSWHLRPESKWVFRNIVRKADTRQSLKILMFTALEVFKEVFQSQHQMMTYHKFIPETFLVLVWVYFGKKKYKKKYVTFCLDAVPKPLPIVYTGLNAPFKNHPRSKKQNLKEDVLFCVQYLWESLAFLFAFQICFETRLLNLFQNAELRNKV